MLKQLVTKTEKIGGDGATITEDVSVDQDTSELVGSVSVRYPLAKIVSPVTNLIDKAAADIESKLSLGGEMKVLLDPIVAGLKAEIVTLLGKI